MMRVRLIGITKPVGLGPYTGSAEALLAYCARVSNAANQANHETGPKLLRSLVRRQEWSPFEMVSATMEIETTRDIARQILRHRSFSFQEFSQRYAEVDDAPSYRDARDAHPTDRQSSTLNAKPSVQDDWRRAQERVWSTAMVAYKAALGRGMAKEVARTLLPEGMTPSRIYMAGTLRSWIHYCGLRSTTGTQVEHQEIAKACWAIVTDQFPALDGVLTHAPA